MAEQLRMLNKEQRAMRRLLEQHVQDTKEVLQEQRRLAEAMDRFDYVPMSGRGTRSVRKPSSVRSTVRQLADRDLDVDTDTEPFLHVQLEDDLKHALLHRWEPAVRSLLDRGANPNMKFWDVISGGTHFSWCTPLAMAATLGNLGIARALLEFGAPASSQYSLVTGAGCICSSSWWRHADAKTSSRRRGGCVRTVSHKQHESDLASGRSRPVRDRAFPLGPGR